MTRAALRKLPDYRDCMAQSCKSGQFHDTKIDGNIFRCIACGFCVCTVHNVPFHTGETCIAYDKRKKVVSRTEEASMRAISRFSVPCPACKVNIEKNGGCDKMKCEPFLPYASALIRGPADLPSRQAMQPQVLLHMQCTVRWPHRHLYYRQLRT